jgi:hypothetical protein
MSSTALPSPALTEHAELPVQDGRVVDAPQANTLAAISNWLELREALAQHERELDASLFSFLLTPDSRASARMRWLQDLYANTGCYRHRDRPNREWFTKIVKARPTRSPSYDAVALGGPYSLLMRLADSNVQTASPCPDISPALQEALVHGAALFNLVAVTLAGSATHRRRPQAELHLSRDELQNAALSDEEALSAALKVFHALKVVQLRLPYQALRHPSDDVIREATCSEAGVAFRFHPAFVKFMTVSLCGRRIG